MVGVAICVGAFLLVLIFVCRYRNSRANAAAAAALAARPQAPPQPEYWDNDERRHRSDRDDDDDGRTVQRASPTAGLPSFAYNRAVRHNNVTGGGDVLRVPRRVPGRGDGAPAAGVSAPLPRRVHRSVA